ncbi:MAG: mannose-1-phosphate guanylyltransferase/mannose-6-phosphate isomerase [Candidatus Gastranaerophilales bacterium]|nr:mannose-1-phosphate guanylyltransferase/mannose-6-phosphate isomerase [Candidatus Gastranaerophilales bacterium]
MTSLYSIILAGGAGIRLWPLSRELYPKQMFKLENDYTLFQKTFLNLAEITDDKNIITAANIKHISQIKEQLRLLQVKFGRKNEYKTITEPISKNTAPALALAVKYIDENMSLFSSNAVILCVPSDQIIYDRIKFSQFLNKGKKLAKEGYIVCFSTESDSINEEFGCMKVRKNVNISEIEPLALKVSKFVEKPYSKEDKESLKGKIYINTGIYMFTAKTFFAELKKYMPEIYKYLEHKNINESIPSIALSDYENMPDISIDYAVINKTKKLVTIPISTEWKDIGSWNSIYEISKKDEKGNYLSGKSVSIDCENSMIYSTSKLAAGIGLKDTFVIETDDAILISEKNNTNKIKNLYKKLSGKNKKTKEIHKTVFRPWGFYTVLENGSGFLTKCITVNPDAKLSLQRHKYRSEHWIILEGSAIVIKGEQTFNLSSGESIDISANEIHSLQNSGGEQLKVLEIQQGDILDENDIERLEDIYGRV